MKWFSPLPQRNDYSKFTVLFHNTSITNKLHVNVYDIFYSLHSHQHVSPVIAAIFRVMLLVQEYKVTNVVSRVAVTPFFLTPWCRVLLEQLTGLQLVKKFPAFHGIQRFITALTSVHHLSLSWANPIQSIYLHPTSWRSILILSTHLRLGLPSGVFPSGFPTKTLYTPLTSPIRATCPAHSSRNVSDQVSHPYKL